MAPTKKGESRVESGHRLSHPPPGDEILISGISGLFPNSDSVKHLEENLFNKVNLISDDERRWKHTNPEIPPQTGKLTVINKFDASFFDLHYKQAHSMDPNCRMLLEKVYESIIDAGMNPTELRGTKTGVFIGASFCESEITWFYTKMDINNYGIVGCSRSMLSNRVSQWLGLTGPSYTVDTACSSSLFALDHAYRAIRNGDCDAAFVGGANLCLHPNVSLQFARLGVLSPDGSCKCFDNSANGYVRSEAIVACFLQKAKDSRRVYARLLHAKTNCDGFKEQGISYPAGKMQKLLLSEFYEECLIDPTSLEYVEAHGTGTVVGDPEELVAIDEVFCTGRTEPLLIGSIKSNLGHCEPASGLCSVAKLCIAYCSGCIPPNLHYKTPREGVACLTNGHVQVVTEKQPWNRGMSGLSSFGFGGANAHMLLKNVAREKINNGLPSDDLPRLVCVSGRTKSAVARILDDVESKPIDVDLVRLWHGVHNYDIPKHNFRGYTLLGSIPTKSVRLSRDSQYFSGDRRPVWFVYSGIGSEWSGMATRLMRIPVFAAAIQKCHDALEAKGLNLTKLIINPDPNIYDNVLHSFVGIAALQIGLTDVLKTVAIEPDHIIGHSFGELGCAYADGCLNTEQTILSAYIIGLAAIETSLQKGSMAIVGLGYKQISLSVPDLAAEIGKMVVTHPDRPCTRVLQPPPIKAMCPPEIEVACHDTPGSSTISGPADIIKGFVSKLTSQGFDAKEVHSYDIAFHSKYISEAGPKLLKHLKKVITSPKPRSERWVSTSVPQDLWKKTDAELSSAEYHTNNFLSPVLFEETVRLMQPNAITIEVAPHGLLQAILQSSLKKSAINIALTQRGHEDNVQVLLTALGKLYEAGLNPHLANIYPHVEFPVPVSTPMMAHLVEWEHSEDWFVSNFKNTHDLLRGGERSVKINMMLEATEYITGHVVDGRNLYPATGYLILMWETLAMMRDQVFTEISVVFENVRFLRATHVSQRVIVEFIVMIHRETGQFEIVEGGTSIVTGRIYVKENVGQTYRVLPSKPESKGPKVKHMLTKNFYKELRLRGYQYSGLFRGVLGCNVEGTRGRIAWANNFVTFIDCMLQLKIISHDTRGLFVPTRIERLSIDIDIHKHVLSQMSPDITKHSFEVRVYPDHDVIRAGGIEVRGLHATPIPRRGPRGIPVLEKNVFVPSFGERKMALEDVLRANIQLILENVQTYKVKSIELVDEEYKIHSMEPIIGKLGDVLRDLPLVQAELQILSKETLEMPSNITIENKKVSTESNAVLFIGANLLKRSDVLNQAVSTLRDKCFVLSRESERPHHKEYSEKYDLVTIQDIGTEYLVMLRKRVGTKPAKFIRILAADQTFSWIEKVKKELTLGNKVVLYSQDDDANGLLGLANCLRREPGGELVYCILIADPSAPPFNPDLEIYEEQLDKDLAINVYQDGQWGTYRHLLLGDLDRINAYHAHVNTLTIGDLSSLTWLEDSIKENHVCKSPVKVLISVYYSALNFRDIMMATGRITADAVVQGRLNQECVQGLEAVGRLQNGSRVMTMTGNRGLSSMLEVDPALLFPVPDEWNFEEACTVPVAYGTVYYGLLIVAKLQRGESVLIHAGSGGVGQAAINVALHHGCEVFTTVGTPEKRELIMELFPQIKDSHIGNSRDTSFEDMIRKETNGKGVNIVLNSLSDEKLQASVRCLSYRGRFVEIGKYDISTNTPIGMQLNMKENSFHGITLDTIFTKSTNFNALKVLRTMRNKGKLPAQEDFQLSHQGGKRTFSLWTVACSRPKAIGLWATVTTYHQALRRHMVLGIMSGAVRPLTHCTFENDEIESAFRYMASGKHIGKVIIKIRKEEDTKELIIPAPLYIDALPRYVCYADYVYVLVGGLGGFGLELADWLIMRGARKLVLTSRKGVSNGYQASRLRVFATYGAEVQISTYNITTEAGCEELLKMANAMGHVEAIFNLAVVLKDSIFENQTPETFLTSFGPKALATMHLDKLSQILCPGLKNFVVFSSVSCGRGNAGQTNYGFSNSFMERICEKRKKLGLPALAVQWGAIGDVGLVADMQDNDVQLEIGGTLQQRISSCLLCLDKLIKQDSPIVSSMVVAEKKIGGTGCGNMVDAVAQIIGIKDLKTVSMNMALADLGMDSMMAVEIKQTLEREFEVFLTAQDIRTLTFGRLVEIKTQKETAASAGTRPVANNDSAGLKLLMRNIGDEKVISKPVIFMPSMVTENLEGEETITDVENIMFLLPGVEGAASALESLCRRLKTRTCVLQLGVKHKQENLEQMVDRLYESVKTRLVPGAPFKLLGYSFGTLSILELAKRLESKGHNGIVFCVDGSPDFLNALITTNIMYENDAFLQISLICHTIDIVMPKNDITKDLMEKLIILETYDERLKYAAGVVPNQSTYSTEFIFASAAIAFDRLKVIQNVDKNVTKLRAPVVLLRPKELPTNVAIEENYGLDKYTDNLTVHLLEGNHITILENKDCANIINKTILGKEEEIGKADKNVISGSIENRSQREVYV